MGLIGGTPEARDQPHNALVPDVSCTPHSDPDAFLKCDEDMLLCCCYCYGSGSVQSSSVGCETPSACRRRLRAMHSVSCQRKTLREVAKLADSSRNGRLFRDPSAPLCHHRCVTPRQQGHLLCIALLLLLLLRSSAAGSLCVLEHVAP